MSDGVGESHRFPPIDGLHDRCCNISNERCRRAPLEFIKSPSPRCLSAKPASAFSSELSLHTYVLELLIYKDVIPRELLVRYTDQGLYRGILTCTNFIYTSQFVFHQPQSQAQTCSFLLFLGSKRLRQLVFRLQSELPDSGLVFSLLVSGLFWSIVLIPHLLSFLTFALYFFIALSSLTQFSRTFRSLCALCLAIAIVLRLVCGDLHSPPSPPLDCRLIPALRPRKFPRLIGTSHNLPGLHSSNPHCFKVCFAFYWVACFALRTEATTSSNRPRAGSSLN
ncbi:hypothetical protein N7501_011923 [Penicillium viridicatum]|nr:hypothetical protein N7501_011923 [Penicillium viridicatum]